MKQLFLRRLALGAATCAAFALGASGSAAALTVSPAGTVLSAASPVRFIIGSSSATATCDTSILDTTITTAGGGTVNRWTFLNCVILGFTSLTVTLTSTPTIAMTLPSAGTVNTTFSGITFTVTSPIGCRFQIIGSQSMSNTGTLPLALGSWNMLPGGSALTTSSVVGCLGLINNGNPVTINGLYILTALQTVS